MHYTQIWSYDPQASAHLPGDDTEVHDRICEHMACLAELGHLKELLGVRVGVRVRYGSGLGLGLDLDF